MKKTILFLFICLAQISWAQSSELLQYISQDAMYTFVLRPQNLNDKANWSEVQEYPAIKEFSRGFGPALGANEPDFFKDLFQNPQKLGINLEQNSYLLFNSEISTDYGTEVEAQLIAPLADAQKFEAACQALFKEEEFKNKSQKDGYNWLQVQGFSLAWNAKVLFIFASTPENFFAPESQEMNYMKQFDMFQQCINMDSQESLNNLKVYNDWEATVRDMGAWLNYERFMQLYAQSAEGLNRELGREAAMFMREIMPLMLSMYGDLYAGMDLSLEKGKIVAESKFYGNQDYIDLYSDIANSKANTKVLNYLDGQNTIFYTYTHFSPEGTYEGLKKLAQKKAGPQSDIVDRLFKFMEIFIDEKASFNFLKGDLFIAFNGLSMQKYIDKDYVYNEESDNYEMVEREVEKPLPNFVVGASYGNKKDILNLIEIVEILGFATKIKSNKYEISLPQSPKFYLVLDGNLLLFGSDKDRLVNGKKYKKMDSKHKAYLKNDNQTIFFSPENAIALVERVNTLKPNTFSERELKEMKRFAKGLQDMSVHTYKPKANAPYIRQEMIWDLENKEENALNTFFRFVNELYLSTQKGM
ncbi:hypothetical protein SapgrDRAFT_1986 [Saprospira grandis DSM 2844]|uniref:DUF4836 domain-containing protein n=1 Tax=Saprospira grandis DSM 2844 TaxID=694433 RepID=J1I4M7_9BACT|nr:DUF4836 family protein [Saprospira grandis]EJF53675.1 hypothetical protein SapgrDRAFT_1986 [Saprospira grandis DSM 2844]